MRVCVSICLFMTVSAALAGATCRNGQTEHNKKCVDVFSQSTPPLSLNDESGILVRWVNRFRFDFNPKIESKSIQPASIPTQLAPTGDKILKAVKDTNYADKSFRAPEMSTDESRADLCNQATWPVDEPAQKVRVTGCWEKIRMEVERQVKPVIDFRNNINSEIRKAAEDQRCYQRKLQNFSQPILTEEQHTDLLKFAQGNECNNKPKWPDSDDIESKLAADQLALGDIVTAPGYDVWLGTSNTPNFLANDALKKLITELLADVKAYGRGVGADGLIEQTRLEFDKVTDANQHWRDRLDGINSQPNSLAYTVDINRCHEWYGRGRTDTISLHVVDVSSSTLAATDIALGTNTCNPLSIASTGIGVSFLANPTYGFIPDASGNQVIGKTAVNDISPLYSVLYNVKSPGFNRSDVELFISPGVGLVSTSSTSNADFLAGLSISFARRLIFLTGSADFGRRDELLPGFVEGAAKGSLTSVPTRSTWKTGAMISVTFGIAPAP